jgi:acyl carrier protein
MAETKKRTSEIEFEIVEYLKEKAPGIKVYSDNLSELMVTDFIDSFGFLELIEEFSDRLSLELSLADVDIGEILRVGPLASFMEQNQVAKAQPSDAR